MKAPDLVAAIGPDAAKAFAAAFGGAKHVIPNLQSVERVSDRNPGILAHFEKMLSQGCSGETAYVITATKYKISSSQVRRVVEEEQKERARERRGQKLA